MKILATSSSLSAEDTEYTIATAQLHLKSGATKKEIVMNTHQIQTERGTICVSDRPYFKEDALAEGYKYSFTAYEPVNLKTKEKMIPVDIYSKYIDMYHHDFIVVAKEN